MDLKFNQLNLLSYSLSLGPNFVCLHSQIYMKELFVSPSSSALHRPLPIRYFTFTFTERKTAFFFDYIYKRKSGYFRVGESYTNYVVT